LPITKSYLGTERTKQYLKHQSIRKSGSKQPAAYD